MQKDFISLKRGALTRYFSHMNDMQREAVFRTGGPLLILAGAGSGKTTVLINRIENLIRFGRAYHSEKVPERVADADLETLDTYINGGSIDADTLAAIIAEAPVRPWSVLAITFTNKAAAELKSRLAEKLGPAGQDVRASTFHSLCMRILRRDIAALGYGTNFTIYDTDDSLRVIKDALKTLGIDEKNLAPKACLSAISRAKDTLTTPEQMKEQGKNDFRLGSVAAVYDIYQQRLRGSNALDFDDLIILTVRLFRQHPDILEYYQNRYRYIMVDEYQDTNHAQYLLISLLAAGHGNLCVVGDDDQSIYKFRGATIENILSFEQQFPDAAVIRLEQNYRSTQNILSAANKVIENNRERKGKNLWTDAGDGARVLVVRSADEVEESRVVADSILDHVREGATFSDHAVLYRMNAQSNSLEKSLAKNAIPYRIVGGLRFYERKEIKDVVAYLSVINNPSDTLRLLRIINEPKRGIGNATLGSAQEIADTLGVDLFEVIESAAQYAPIASKANVLGAFAAMIRDFQNVAENQPLEFLMDKLLVDTGYMKSLEAQGFEGIGRIENVLELKSNIVKYMQEAEEPTLGGFLEEIALYTDLDNYDTSADAVTLMTVHSAKGLEFRYVYIAGMDDGVFPGRMAIGNDAELEEERRLAYVAITRAKERLTIVSAERRLMFGQTMFARPSRFISEIPEDLLELKSTLPQRKPAVKAEPRKPGTPSSRTIGVGSAPQPSAAASAQPVVRLSPGDKVLHKVFGEGRVLSAKPMAADTLLEIDFSGLGVKKIMANFARLQKID